MFNKYLIKTKKSARGKGYHRFYCRNCNGYILTKTSFGKRFCRICNGMIKNANNTS